MRNPWHLSLNVFHFYIYMFASYVRSKANKILVHGHAESKQINQMHCSFKIPSFQWRQSFLFQLGLAVTWVCPIGNSFFFLWNKILNTECEVFSSPTVVRSNNLFYWIILFKSFFKELTNFYKKMNLFLIVNNFWKKEFFNQIYIRIRKHILMI